MKFLHLSDLHIGKNVNGFSMLEEQIYILDRILEIIDNNNVDGVLIAGDVYDRSIPAVEAVKEFDDFLTELAKRNKKVFIISGNHDSPERLNFGSRILERNGIYIAGEYDGSVQKICLEDELGKVNVFLLPYIFPQQVKSKLNVDVKSFDDAVRAALATCEIDETEKNILVAHQFVTAGGESPKRSESETKSVGGLDNVDVSAFDKFDYVALGHIHGPQKIGRDTVRYSGSPLKYSFSECLHKKSVPLITVSDKVSFELIPLTAKRDMVKFKSRIGDLKNVLVARDSYVHITLTDEETIVDAISKVRDVFPNVMQLEFENRYTGEHSSKYTLTSEDVKGKSPEELFKTFFLERNGTEMSEEQTRILIDIVDEIRKEERQ